MLRRDLSLCGCLSQMCVAGPVVMRFSSHTALLAVERPAYVHMPVWIDVDAPASYFCALSVRILAADFFRL